MRPLSPLTAQLFSPLEIHPLDRCRLEIDDTLSKFVADFWSYREKFTVTRTLPTVQQSDACDRTKANWHHFRPIAQQVLQGLQGYLPDETTKYSPSSETEKLIKRIPERKELTKGIHYSPCAYEMAATDFTVELIAALFPKQQLTFADEATELKFYEILARSNQADYCAEVVARYQGSGQLPEQDYEFCEEFPPAPYQVVATHCALRSPGYALFMEQGTGKTPVSIAVICNLIAEHINAADGKMFRCIVVTPKNVRANWESEIAKFTTRNGRVTVLRGPEIGRVKQMIDAFSAPAEGEEFTVVVCGYETLTKSWEAIEMVPWDLAILDESHFIKSERTKRWQTCEKLRERSSKRMILTGTPIANSIMDMWTQLEFLGKGYSGFNTFKAFKKFYGVYEYNDVGHAALAGMQNLPFMQERLARYSFIINKATALPDLPERVYDIYECEMGDQQSEFYREVLQKLHLEIESDLNSSDLPRQMIISNSLTKMLRLAQITSGFMNWSEIQNEAGETVQPSRIEYFNTNPKIEGLLDMLYDKTPQQKTQIWACWIPDIDYISHALKTHGIEHVTYYGDTSDAARAAAEYRFNFDRNCRVFVGNPSAGGTGLNLLGYPPSEPENYDTNCDHVIYFSQNWSRLHRDQSEARGHRRGTRVPVRITDLMFPRTIDEEIRMRVLEKKMLQFEISDIREILNSVFSRLETV